MHVGRRALSIKVHNQDHEGYLTPTCTYSAHVLERVQLLHISRTKSGKTLVVGPAQGTPPLLKHYKVMGKPLAKCETKHFHKVLRKIPPKAQREKLAELCTFWASYVGWGFKPSNIATLKHKGSKLPLLHQEQWVHTKVDELIVLPCPACNRGTSALR